MIGSFPISEWTIFLYINFLFIILRVIKTIAQMRTARSKMKNYGYIRVSTDKQTVENQRYEISQFCKQQNLHIDGWIKETISGTRSYDKRALGKLLRKVKSGDLIICSELSRLGRNLFMIMEILSTISSPRCWHLPSASRPKLKEISSAFGQKKH